ncbi:MAG: hypothetical protein LC734_05465, partial [Acidobacteria bacterium]|nr:hypothetical protein [Acidobacteriota bacterium]
VDIVLDKAAQKGTGKWTSQVAMDIGVPIPTIDAAVSMRQISAQKEVRELLAAKYDVGKARAPATAAAVGDVVESVQRHDLKAELARGDVKTVASEQHRNTLGATGKNSNANDRVDGNPKEMQEFDTVEGETGLSELKHALLCSFIVIYTQGMSLLQTASVEKQYGLNLSEVARIWRGGCIIRSALLEEMRRAFTVNADLPSLLLDDEFASIITANHDDWASVLDRFAKNGVPALCLTSSMNYFEALRSRRLPANLIQAQRDYFGAHTYQRIDKEGIFHTPDWTA